MHATEEAETLRENITCPRFTTGPGWDQNPEMEFPIHTLPTPLAGQEQAACWSPGSSGQPRGPKCSLEQADITSQVETAGQRSGAQALTAPFLPIAPLLRKIPRRWVAFKGKARFLPEQQLLTSLHPHLKSGPFQRHN